MPRVALDSNVIIYFLDTSSELQDQATMVLELGNKGVELIVSDLLFLELLAKPAFTDKEATELYELSRQLPFRIEPIRTDILLLAAKLRRSTPTLKTPDAIHLATALSTNASHFITNDKHILSQQIKDVQIVSLGSAQTIIPFT